MNEKVALKEIKKPNYRDPSLDVLIKRGQDHEAAYVKFLSGRGLKVIDLRGQSVEATIDAMKNGVDVVVQGQLEAGAWGGYTDILLKVDGKSKFGNWSYEDSRPACRSFIELTDTI